MTQNTIILKQRRDTKDLKNFQYYKPVVSFLEILYKRHHESLLYSSLPANITGTNSLWILNRSHLHTNPNKGENEWLWRTSKHGICCSWNGIWLCTDSSSIWDHTLTRPIGLLLRMGDPKTEQRPPTKKVQQKSSAIVLPKLFSILPGRNVKAILKEKGD